MELEMGVFDGLGGKLRRKEVFYFTMDPSSAELDHLLWMHSRKNAFFELEFFIHVYVS